jgi:hypothetical protein
LGSLARALQCPVFVRAQPWLHMHDAALGLFNRNGRSTRALAKVPRNYLYPPQVV